MTLRHNPTTHNRTRQASGQSHVVARPGPRALGSGAPPNLGPLRVGQANGARNGARYQAAGERPNEARTLPGPAVQSGGPGAFPLTPAILRALDRTSYLEIREVAPGQIFQTGMATPSRSNVGVVVRHEPAYAVVRYSDGREDGLNPCWRVLVPKTPLPIGEGPAV